MNPSSRARRLGGVLVATLAGLLSTAASAHAAQIGVVQHPELNAPVLQFVGDDVRDQVSIYYQNGASPQTFEYSSGITQITAAAGCTPTSATSGTCNGPVEYVLAFGQGGNDDITLSLCALGAGTGCGSVVPGIAFGGAGDDILIGQVVSAFETQLLPTYAFAGDDGNDRLEGASGGDELYGDAGNDTLQARDGADLVNGGTGDDALSAEDTHNAGDTYVGGDGYDKITSSLDFSGYDGEVTMSLDGAANDGAPGEGDNVGADVERVDAYGRSVTMVGSDGPNELRSFGTTSTIRGLGGDDRLFGWDGADAIEGGEGNDHLEGGFGPDVLDGGGGVDVFMGDTTERDVIATGNDQIRARDGLAEQVNCGIGSDSAVVDAADVVDPSCEAVDRGASPGPGPEVSRSLADRLGLSVGRPTLRKLARRGLSFSLTCPTACRVAAELRLGARKVGSGSARLRAGRKGTVKVRLSKAGRRRLAGKRRATLALRIRVTGTAPNAGTITQRLKLKR